MTTRALVLLLLPIAALTLGCPSREAPREPAPVEEAARGDAAGAQIATPRSPNPAADAEQTPTGRPAGAAQTGAPGASPDRPDVRAHTFGCRGSTSSFLSSKYGA